MRKDNLRITDNSDKMRLHYRKRSNKTKLSESENASEHHSIDLQNATESELITYRNIMEGDETDDKVYAGSIKPSGKTIIIDPVHEKLRKVSTKIDKITVFSLVIVITIIVAAIIINFISNSNLGQKLIDSVSNDHHITEQGNYKFGAFEGYVTIGSSFDEAVDILGMPTPGSEGQYFFGNSYILVEDDIVVGYHKDRGDYFHVTVGYKDIDSNPIISLGDSARRVVSKLGSPETYHKYQWTYADMNQNFVKNSYYSSNAYNLIVSFNENYEVIGYEFVHQ